MLYKFRKNSALIILTLFMSLTFNTIIAAGDTGSTSEVTKIPVSITSPSNYGSVNIPTIRVTGYGQPNASLDLSLDGSNTSGTVHSDGSWEIVLPSVTYGKHKIYVTQQLGSYTSTASINVTVIKSVLKDIDLVDPKHLLTVTEACPTIKGTAEPYAKVVLSINSKDYIGYSDASGAWSITITDKLPNKQYVITLTEEEEGLFSQSLASVYVNAPEVKEPVITSINGTDKYDTSIKFSQMAYKTADTVIIATGDSFADALCVVPLAKYNKAPILFVNNAEKTLDAALLQEMKRLGATHAIIVGGIGAISQEIQDKLVQKQLNVERIGGADRYETSYLIAKKLPASKTIAIVTGENYADALSVSPAAGYMGIPIILNPYNSESTYVRKYITENNVTTTYVLGSEGVISREAVKNTPNVIRIGGKDRYETNKLVLKQFKPTGKNLIVATGKDYSDALIGGAYAANDNSSLLLVGDTLTKDIEESIVNTNYENHIMLGNTEKMYLDYTK